MQRVRHCPQPAVSPYVRYVRMTGGFGEGAQQAFMPDGRVVRAGRVVSGRGQKSKGEQGGARRERGAKSADVPPIPSRFNAMQLPWKARAACIEPRCLSPFFVNNERLTNRNTDTRRRKLGGVVVVAVASVVVAVLDGWRCCQ